MSAARAAYTAGLYALLPHAFAHLYWRSRREPAYRRHIGERFGFFTAAAATAPVIWIHAVSVGETRAVEPLVRELMARYPTHRVLLTHMTPTGRSAGESLFGDRVLRAYLPYDFPGAVGRFLEHFQPRIGFLLETEVWPNLIAAARRRAIPLYLVNGRLSERSFRRYRRFAGLSRESFSSLAGVAAQTEHDAARLRTLGARNVIVSGNLKFDATPAAGLVQLGREWRRQYGERPVLLAASTRDGEEALLVDALIEINIAGLLLLLVPRHPQRFDEVAALLERRGLPYVRRSTGAAVSAGTQVVLGDTMGEMAAYYAACDLAFVGGSLLPFGGQNLIEACALGKPVLIGPYTYNFSDAAEQAIGAGAATRVQSAQELALNAQRLLAAPEVIAKMGACAAAFSRAHQGATARVLDLIGSVA